MKTLNLLTKALLCLIMIQLSLACSESKSKRSGVGVYRAPVKDVKEQGADSAIATITGAVVASFSGNVSQSEYQKNVNAFATAFMMPEDDDFGLGVVSHVYEEITNSSGTGIRLNLNICLSDKTEIDRDKSYNNVSIRGGSTPLTIYIKDSKVVENSEDYSPLEISGYTVRGTVNGKTINLTFENSLGIIKMNGNYSLSRDWFAGNIFFENKVNFVKGEGEWSSQLGQFYVQMSSLSKGCF